jgi:hypothetical protein
MFNERPEGINCSTLLTLSLVFIIFTASRDLLVQLKSRQQIYFIEIILDKLTRSNIKESASRSTLAVRRSFCIKARNASKVVFC